jgi:hypothetical protein
MMKKIRLELARNPEFPEGNPNIGYEFVAPLNDSGRIDVEQWQANRGRCRVARFNRDAEEEIGHLVRKPGGSWGFHYDIHGGSEVDDSGYRFGEHKFSVGEYVSLREEDDELRTYKVARVTPAG